MRPWIDKRKRRFWKFEDRWTISSHTHADIYKAQYNTAQYKITENELKKQHLDFLPLLYTQAYIHKAQHDTLQDKISLKMNT